MHSQFDFDNTMNSEDLNNDRNVLNNPEDSSSDLVFHTHGSKVFLDNTSLNDPGNRSLEFTDNSTSFMSPYEDLDLLNGSVQPVVRNSKGEVVRTVSTYNPKVYDPSKDATTGFGNVSLDSVNKKTGDKFTKESFGLPDFFTSPVDLVILSVILVAVIVLEIIGLIAVL